MTEGLNAKITVELSSDTKKLLDVLSKGVITVGSTSPSQSKSKDVESKKGQDTAEKHTNLLMEIAKGVVLGNIVTQAFQDYIRPIMTLFRIILTLFFLPLIPIVSLIVKAFAGMLPTLSAAMKDISRSLSVGLTQTPATDAKDKAKGAGTLMGALIGFAVIGATIASGGTLTLAGAVLMVLAGIITGWLGGVIGVDVGSWIQDNITSPIGKFLSDSIAAATGFDALKWITDNVLNPIKDFLQPKTKPTATTGEAKDPVQDAKSFLKKMSDNLVNGWTIVSNEFTKKDGLLDQAKAFLKNIGTGLSNAWTDLKKTIDDWKTNWPTQIASIATKIKEMFVGFINGIIGWLNGLTINTPLGAIRLPHVEPIKLDKGGYITKSGLAEVHQGETVVPANTSAGMNYSPTYNISADVDGNALKKMLQEHDRQFLSRLKTYGNGGTRIFNA